MGAPGTNALIERLQEVFTASADPALGAAMRSYMRDMFPFLGMKTPERRAASRKVLAGAPAFGEEALAEIAEACWELPEREYQYFACDLLVRNAKRLSADFVPVLRRLVVAKSWWDTVDPLAARVAGGLVRAEPALVRVMDEWIEEEDLWLVRVALLHQLLYRAETDAGRLFRYCERRAGESFFFVRKAIGWALREYAKSDPAAVRAFVTRTELSPLSRREALKHLGE
ncbi:DNA alkylation repair protein [Phytomonospora sp. NPDC050363]|uniref:DNA alkylation repair protein n=1 Tax=Phytomonospora sp. NPDC050363 TaxID=3155642 RepID=UPI003403B9BD